VGVCVQVLELMMEVLKLVHGVCVCM